MYDVDREFSTQVNKEDNSLIVHWEEPPLMFLGLSHYLYPKWKLWGIFCVVQVHSLYVYIKYIFEELFVVKWLRCQ